MRTRVSVAKPKKPVERYVESWTVMIKWNDKKKAESWVDLDNYMNSQDIDEGITEMEQEMNSNDEELEEI